MGLGESCLDKVLDGGEPTADESAELKRWDRHYVWHAFTQMSEYEPLLIEKAVGCTLEDIDGNQYLDGVSSLWCNVHGHRHPKLDAAIIEQLGKVAHVTNLGVSNSTTVRLAKRLVDLTPDGLNHVFFSSDGSSAVEVALKIAFQYWQQRDAGRSRKTKYIAFDNAYHGDTIGGTSIGGIADFHELFHPLLFDVIRMPAPDCYRLPSHVAADAACEYHLAALRKVLAERHDEVAAVVIEPLVQGAAGMILQPPGYLRGVRELTRQYNVLMIADEVAVGFGRTGKMFACEHEQVSPDLLCLAKGLTGGYLPMSATLATTDIWDAFLGDFGEAKTFFHGHTYGGNPLAAAVAMASIDVFDEEQTLAKLQPKIAYLANRLRDVANHPHVGDVRQRGFMVGVELVADRETRTPFPWREKRGQLACRHALDKGVWLRPLGNVIVVMPPLSISLDQLDRICEALRYGIDQATEN